MIRLKLYIADNEKLTKFDLPQEIQESFLVPYKPIDLKKEYTISVEAVNGKWILKSNGSINIIQNGSIALESELKAYVNYELEVAVSKQKINIFCLPVIEENSIDLNSFNMNKIIIGNSSTCHINYQNNYLNSQHIVINVQNNKANLTTQYSNVYLNGISVRSSYLKYGDVIFCEGLKIIWMGFFIRVNNPMNGVIINGLQLYAELSNIDNQNYDKSDIEASELKLYNENDYFYHIPRIKKFLASEEIVIQSPPSQEKDNNLPFLLSMGTSLTMSVSSFVSMYTLITGVKEKGTSIGSIIPSLIICITMIFGSILMPRLTSKYNKKQMKKREELRQKKYGDYLNEKEFKLKKIIEEQRQIMDENYPSIKSCCNIITSKDKQLWERNIKDEDFLSLRLGRGEETSNIKIQASEKEFDLIEDNLKDRVFEIIDSYKKLQDVPIITNLKENTITSIICENKNKRCYVNNIILQLVTLHSASDLKIVYLTGNMHSEYIKYMPHSWSEDKTKRFYATNLTEKKEISEFLEKEYKERTKKVEEASNKTNEENDFDSNAKYNLFSTYYLIVVDSFKDVKNISIINTILNQKSNLGFSILIFEDTLKDVPTQCQNFVYVKDVGSYLIQSKENENIIKNFNVEEQLNYDMNAICRLLSNIPISSKQGELELPKSLTFMDMYKVSKIEQLNILNRWKENDPTKSLKVPIGVHKDGDLFLLDLHEKMHGPHGLIAGSTGSGKSEFIITFVLSMAINYHPEEVAFVLIDYKGGGLAGAFENREKGISIPHLAGTITNLDTSEMNRTLVSINSELKRRQSEFNKARDALGEGTIDIYKYQKFYRQGKVKDPIPHLFIVSDEFAELKSQQPDFMDELISTARIGRSLGVHLILATQKPSGVVNDQIWANSKFKICLKVQDRGDSMEMLKRPEAAEIKETGRFYLQVGYNEYFDIGQSGWAGAKYLPSDRIVSKVDESIDFINATGNSYKNIEDEVVTNVKQEDLGEQLPNIVKYIVDLAKKQDIKTKLLWLSSIPDKVYLEGLKVKYGYKASPYIINPVIGEYDNPQQQEQGILTLNLTEVGNTAIYGMVGSGKENLLQTIIYETCLTHSPEEINFYILDFGAETLKVFSKFPHVGTIATLDDENVLNNLIKMITEELGVRKELFSDYGGNYTNYIKESGKKLPLISIIINGYDAMCENFPRLEDLLFPLLREGMKYGLTFIATTTMSNGINGRASQMFFNIISLQQKNDDLYRDLTGCKRGLVPKKYFGRGIVAKNKTGYEFQSAYICVKEKIGETIRNSVDMLNKKYTTKAKQIKTLPKIVTRQMIQSETTGIEHVALGINKLTLNTSFYNFDNLPVTMVLSNRIFDNFGFVYSLINTFANINNVKTTVVDTTGLYKNKSENINLYNKDYDIALKEIINNVNSENSNNNKRIFIFIGIGILKSKLNENGQVLYNLLFDNIIRFKNSKIIMVDDYTPFQSLELESWYNKAIVNTNGIWLGTNPTDQNAIDFSSITREQKDDDMNNVAYTCGANKVIELKYMVEEGDLDDRQQSNS